MVLLVDDGGARVSEYIMKEDSIILGRDAFHENTYQSYVHQ